MRSTIKSISIIMSLLCVFSLFSCEKQAEEYTYDHAADFSPDEGEVFQDVPTGEYNGYTFHILNAKTGSGSSKMDSDSISGSKISDMIYFRNKNVEERLNIEITETRDTPETVYKTVLQSVMADEDLYSAVFLNASYMASLSAGGYLVSSDYLLEADYDKPWWKKDIMEELSIDNTEYMLISDMQMSFYDSHNLICVNMDIVNKLDGLEVPYTYVDNGTWTVSKMLEMMEIAESDTDGNGFMTYEDRYGIALDSTDAIPLILACDIKLCDVDEYDFPYLTATQNEKLYDVYTLITQSLYDRCSYVYDADKSSADGMSSVDMFKNSRSLFTVTTVGELSKLQATDAEIGLLPMPKYSSEQTEYISPVTGDSLFTLGIPASGRNFLRSGIILENLAAEAYREDGLRDTYVNQILEFRYAVDQKSRDNLHIVLNATHLDLIEIYQFGDLADIIASEASSAGENLMSTLASAEQTVKNDISDYISALEKLK